jgi:EAL domain-containing protein (putative c-di-GMP-specific phosphodiesterase class I)
LRLVVQVGLSLATLPVQRPEDTGPPAGADIEVRRVLAGAAATRLAYQPIVDLANGNVVGYEALARFGPTGLRAPGPYFAAAERAGRGPELEALLLTQVLAARDDRPPGCFLAVNLSPALLTHRTVSGLLADAGDLSGLVIELTEYVPVDDLSALRRRMDALRSQGALLALDDVGAGWSGLRQVAELHPDIVKLDRSLISDVDRDPVKQGLVELTVAFVARLGSKLLAEGVERFEELDAVARLGAPLAQGWLLGRPALRWPDLPADVVTALALRRAHTEAAPRLGNHVDRTAPCVRHIATIGFLPDDPADVVVIDAQRTPQQLWVRNLDPGGPSGWLHPVTTVYAGGSPTDALAQAVTRPQRTRFDPLVCIDDDGSYVGLVHVEHLVSSGVTAGAEPPAGRS